MGSRLGFGNIYYRAGERYVEFSTIPTITESGADGVGEKYRFNDVFTDSYTFIGTVKIDENAKAQLLGFKNANCLSRHIRRAKQKKEQERRKKIKEEQ